MRNFKFDHVFIGRTPEQRERVFVDVEWDGTRLSFTGTVLRPGQPITTQNPTACGQVIDDVRKVSVTLADLWERWHLNDMRAGCEHQEALFREDASLRPTWKNEYKGMGVPCPECGYKYGSEWKAETVPEDVLREVRDLMKAYRTLAA